MPLPFEFEGKGVVLLEYQNHSQLEQAEFVVPYANPLVHFQDFVSNSKRRKYIYNQQQEPTSVLDNITTSPSPPTSTLSSSHGGADLAGVAPAPAPALSSKWPPENQETNTTTTSTTLLDLQHFQQQISTGNDKCATGMDDWESPDSGQDQAMLRWIMGDVEDPSLGLNKMLHSTGGTNPSDFDFSGGFGVVDQGFISLDSGNSQLSPATAPAMFHTHHQNQIFSSLSDTQMVPFDIKPNLFNPPFEHQLLMPPQPKRYSPGSIDYNPSMHKSPFVDSAPNPLQLLQKSPSMKKIVTPNVQNHLQQHQQGIIDQLFKAADLIQLSSSANNNNPNPNNPILVQGILARLNHQLSPIGKPFERAAFYFKEALNLLIDSILTNNSNPQISRTNNASPFSLIFKIGAYKSFSEISPYIQFANFTCNQALLESLNGFDHIHIIDFDIGYGGQWASLMQELALRNNGVSSLKITAFASPSTHDQLELGLTRENLIHFASEINVGFDFEIVNIDVLASSSWSLPFNLSDNEAIAVNLPIHVFSNHQTQIANVLRFVKSLSPKIVVSVDRGCDRTDLPFSNHLIHALQSYSNLLESLDAVNMNLDSLQKIERFLVQPAIEKIVLGRFVYPEKTQHWRNLFLSAGFSPLLFSNFTESQAECLVKRTPVRDFHVEKRQSLLVLCWQRRELVSASAWRC